MKSSAERDGRGLINTLYHSRLIMSKADSRRNISWWHDTNRPNSTPLLIRLSLEEVRDDSHRTDITRGREQDAMLHWGVSWRALFTSLLRRRSQFHVGAHRSCSCAARPEAFWWCFQSKPTSQCCSPLRPQHQRKITDKVSFDLTAFTVGLVVVFIS